MDTIEVDPWKKNKKNALLAYRVDGTLFTIPYVIYRDLTFKKTKEKYIEECRRLPKEYRSLLDEKNTLLLNKPIFLEPPIELKDNVKVYLQESSSQHMTTILDGIEEAKVKFESAEFIVAAETLNKIAGSVYNQEISWKLRAFVEDIQGKKMIVLCDDDLEKIVPNNTQREGFYKERLESMSFSQELCERSSENRSNPFLHGCLAVQSSLSDGTDSVDMVVLGEVDMVADHQPAISFVMSGIGRSNRVNFGNDEDGIARYYEYLWSRSFWLGLGTCFFGLRPADDEQIQLVQRFSLYEFYRQHRHRNGKLADVATSCVARVLLRLREAVSSNPRVNWNVEYEGRDVDFEPDYIRIQEAADSYSFWLIREKFHLEKEEIINQHNQKDIFHHKERKCPQKSGLKIPRKSGSSIAKQFRKYIRIQ